MSAFIDQAKEVLTTEQMSRLELLARKSADFDTNSDEDSEFIKLKQEVKRLVATRDRQKNLSFLKDGQYPLKDILEIYKGIGNTKKQALQAINEVFPKDAGSAEAGFAGVLATYGNEDVTLNSRITKVLGKTIADGGVKMLVANLTDAGKEWITQSYVSEKGPYKGQTIFGNINKIATKFKFNKDALKKELSLGQMPAKAPNVAADKKAETKKAA